MNDSVSINGWQALVVIVPALLAFLTAALGTILAFLAKAQSEQILSEGQGRGRQNEVIDHKLDDVKVMVNGGLSAAKTEIEALKATVLDLRAQLADERGGNK